MKIVVMAFHSGKREKIKKLQSSMRNYVPPIFKEKKPLTIAVFGNTGAGKSSVINSFLSIFQKDDFATMAQVADEGRETGMTVFRNPYKPTPHIKLVDNCGMDDFTDEQVLDEVKAQLDGRRGYGTHICPKMNLPDVSGEVVHIAILVVNGKQEYGPDMAEYGRKLIQGIVECQGRAPFAIITHADVVGQETKKMIRLYLKEIGICESDIFEVENVTPKKKRLSDKYKLVLLELLKRCTNDMKVVMQHKNDHRREMEEMKRQQPVVRPRTNLPPTNQHPPTELAAEVVRTPVNRSIRRSTAVNQIVEYSLAQPERVSRESCDIGVKGQI